MRSLIAAETATPGIRLQTRNVFRLNLVHERTKITKYSTETKAVCHDQVINNARAMDIFYGLMLELISSV